MLALMHHYVLRLCILLLVWHGCIFLVKLKCFPENFIKYKVLHQCSVLIVVVYGIQTVGIVLVGNIRARYGCVFTAAVQCHPVKICM